MYDFFATPRAVHRTSQTRIPQQAAISFPRGIKTASLAMSPELQVGSFITEPPGKHTNPQFMNFAIHGKCVGLLNSSEKKIKRQVAHSLKALILHAVSPRLDQVKPTSIYKIRDSST